MTSTEIDRMIPCNISGQNLKKWLHHCRISSQNLLTVRTLNQSADLYIKKIRNYYEVL